MRRVRVRGQPRKKPTPSTGDSGARHLHRRALDEVRSLVVEGFAEVHEVEATLAEGGSDGRLGRRFARGHHQPESLPKLGHDGAKTTRRAEVQHSEKSRNTLWHDS
tara:strand:- start:4679 stop:4996 length:318 start_codon:yes stop_codon:yes gene_type:complete